MKPFLDNHGDCTACSACLASCPTQCITMQADAKGFLYPVRDKQRCIHCHRCELVCPFLHVPKIPKNLDEKLAFAAITKDTTNWKASSSGGAFVEICRSWGEDEMADTWIFGAIFEGFIVVHRGALLKNVSLFHKSKYVQSQMDTCFCQIKELLEQNKRVVFSGTPCQVAGLRNFLGRDYASLLCIDFICHGVGSPAVFRRYLTELEHKTGKKIRAYTFRAKRSVWGNFPRYQSEVTYQDDSVRYYIEDNYNKLFLNQLCLRECCGEHCQYRHIRRYGDFTIADFNNLLLLLSYVKDARNYSSLICNTSKAKSLLPRLQQRMVLFSCSVEQIVQCNPLLARTTPENPQRAACLHDFEKGLSVEQLVDKYVRAPRFSIVSWIRGHIPFTIKYYIFCLYKKLCK